MSDPSVSISLSQLQGLFNQTEGQKKRRGGRPKKDAEENTNSQQGPTAFASTKAHDDLRIKLIFHILAAASDQLHSKTLKW